MSTHVGSRQSHQFEGQSGLREAPAFALSTQSLLVGFEAARIFTLHRQGDPGHFEQKCVSSRCYFRGRLHVNNQGA
uniref:Uncharacterized protein n=1 Tax=Ixodes ricinus TaxID=34613 RepID=A0A6B0U3X8_IXORI